MNKYIPWFSKSEFICVIFAKLDFEILQKPLELRNL